MMNQEIEESFELEREKMKATMVAINPQLQPLLYPEEHIVSDEEIEWYTPRTEEEMSNIIAQLDQIQVGSEVLR